MSIDQIFAVTYASASNVTSGEAESLIGASGAHNDSENGFTTISCKTYMVTDRRNQEREEQDAQKHHNACDLMKTSMAFSREYTLAATNLFHPTELQSHMTSCEIHMKLEGEMLFPL